MAGSRSVAICVAVTADGAAVGGVATGSTGRCSNDALIAVPQCCYFVTVVGMAAGFTGIDGVTGIGTGGATDLVV